MVRVALVGIGDAGKHHARALLGGTVAGAELAAIVVRDAAKGAAFRAELQVPVAVRDFPSLEALLAARACDAVVLATPDGAHAEQVEVVVAHGLPVLVEKPLALTAEAGARAIDAARRANVHLQVGYQLRYHPAHRRMRAEQRERIGALRTIHLRWAWPDPAVDGWRAQGRGARFWSLAALGTHCIDLALLFGGALPEKRRVAAILEPASGIDRGAEVSFALGNGAAAHVSVALTHR
ncbi:MAG: Gfo/Idh/MocA family oxidoreductase, partial [Polyangiaceae bacterium]|nr:Gfo/Idh/MocA family oxidoreductase [Polyangiaceae bacterium]